MNIFVLDKKTLSYLRSHQQIFDETNLNGLMNSSSKSGAITIICTRRWSPITSY
jgi:hypothetical protein